MNDKTKKIVLLSVGVVLLLIGLIKPSLNNVLPTPTRPIVSVEVSAPKDPTLLSLAQEVAKNLQDNNASKDDCLRLSSLYADLASLISLSGEDEVVKNTEEVRQANRIAGLMLKMNLNDKYPNLATAMNNLVIKTIGDDNISLTPELRVKTVDSFNALSWATNEGAK